MDMTNAHSRVAAAWRDYLALLARGDATNAEQAERLIDELPLGQKLGDWMKNVGRYARVYRGPDGSYRPWNETCALWREHFRDGGAS